MKSKHIIMNLLQYIAFKRLERLSSHLHIPNAETSFQDKKSAHLKALTFPKTTGTGGRDSCN